MKTFDRATLTVVDPKYQFAPGSTEKRPSTTYDVSMTTVFVRDDDLGSPVESLDRFNAVFIDRKIPVAYQVVPALLHDDVAEWSIDQQRRNPGLVELHQHGNLHEQTLNGTHLYSEFAGDVPEADQRVALADGRSELADRLGAAFDPTVFTPPAHKYGPTTLALLGEMGVRVLSCGVHPGLLPRVVYTAGRLGRRVRIAGHTISYHGRRLPGGELTEWSCAIDVDQDGKGNRVNRSLEDLRAQFTRARAELDVVGLMLHHEGYDGAEKFDALERFLDELVQDPTVQFAALGSLPDA